MKKDLILEAEVVKEATNLKKHITKKELRILNYDTLEGDSAYYCIYGQLTGNCNSDRSRFLINKCCKKVYKTQGGDLFKDSILNGDPNKIDLNNSIRVWKYISPIEKLLGLYKPKEYNKSTKIKKLVDFLKGDIKELKF